MKKFKKPLTINIVQDTHQTPSPNTESKQITEYQNHLSDSYQNKHKLDPYQNQRKINVVEFQEFKIDGDNQDDNNQFKYQVKERKSELSATKNKRQFVIQIPDAYDQQISDAIFYQTQPNFKFKNNKVGTFKQDLTKNINTVKEPPAPSNRAKLNKNNKFFVFPTNDQLLKDNKETISRNKIIEPKTDKSQNRKNSDILISQQDHLRKVQQIIRLWTCKLQDCNKMFQKERQQFYKEKSNMEKDLLIKNGQIQMLQKLITDRYSPKAQSRHSPKNQFYSQQNHKNYQSLILEKDLQINNLLQRINQLNRGVESKNSELENVKINNLKLQSTNQSLRNQLYVYERKEASDKVTRQFYVMKEKQKTPKDASRKKWEQQIANERNQREKQIQKQKQVKNDRGQFGLRGIQDLHKRLQSLKLNRMQLEGRGKIKSEVDYSQTSKNKGQILRSLKRHFKPNKNVLSQRPRLQDETQEICTKTTG